MSRCETITIFSHRNTAQTADALREVVGIALDAGVRVRVPPEEAAKHAFDPHDGLVLDADPDGPTDLALVLGGDGTILSTLRRFAGRDVPVFAFNYGAIGFLATVEHDDLEGGMRMALGGEFDVMALPALTAATAQGDRVAVAPRGRVRIEFQQASARLAMAPGASFYHRMRDKFGRLAR